MGETRVDLLHLLEDLRDAYPDSLEETILTASSTLSRSSSAYLSSTTARWPACGSAELPVSRRRSHALGARSCASPSPCSLR
jgi:hypothetical protein